MTSGELIERIRNLRLAAGKFIVVGSGIMTMHGLKDGHDIDLVVAPDIFETFSKKNDWKTQFYTYPKKIGKTYLQNGNIEMYLDVNYGNFNPTLEELLSRAEFFDGIPFICLPDLIRFKIEYDRPKDHVDIEKIKIYLKGREVSVK